MTRDLPQSYGNMPPGLSENDTDGRQFRLKRRGGNADDERDDIQSSREEFVRWFMAIHDRTVAAIRAAHEEGCDR